MLHTSNNHNMPHGLGLLTTVASLPPKYRSRYLSIKTKCETPLDLSVKPISPIPTTPTNNSLSPQIAQDVPMAINFTEVYTEPIDDKSNIIMSNAMETNVENDKPMTPPLTPTLTNNNNNNVPTVTATIVSIKRKYAESLDDESKGNLRKLAKKTQITTTNNNKTVVVTPLKPIKQTSTAATITQTTTTSSTKHATNNNNNNNHNKHKVTRKLKFDEETSSPVSGTIIRPLEDVTASTAQYSNGDIDPRYNIVEISEESKAELAAIKNVIGDYICKLCRLKFDDAFGLARHRCACIVLLEYRCPECGKQFNCPANLASHRRWHKPKKDAGASSAKKENQNTINTTTLIGGNSKKSQSQTDGGELPHACEVCGKKFKRQAYLRKHQSTHGNAKSTTVSKITASTKEEELNDATSTYKSYASSTASTSTRTSSISSQHSYAENHEEEEQSTQQTTTQHTVIASYEYEVDDAGILSDDCSSRSSSSAGYGRLQIVENCSGLTEEENIAAAALTNLRNCASVIKHTTLAH